MYKSTISIACLLATLVACGAPPETKIDTSVDVPHRTVEDAVLSPLNQECASTKYVLRLVEFSDNVPDAERAVIMQAAHSWDMAFNYRIKHYDAYDDILKDVNAFSYKDKRKTQVVYLTSTDSKYADLKDLGITTQTVALTQYNTIYVFIEHIEKLALSNGVLYAQLLYYTLRHEFGHDVFLWHTADPKGVMWYKSPDVDLGFQKSDYDEFCRVWGCDASKLVEEATKQPGVECNVRSVLDL